MRIITAIFVMLVPFIIFWLIGSFIAYDLNPYHWEIFNSWYGRIVLLFIFCGLIKASFDLLDDYCWIIYAGNGVVVTRVNLSGECHLQSIKTIFWRSRHRFDSCFLAKTFFMNFAFYVIKNTKTGLYQSGNKSSVGWTDDVTKARKFNTKSTCKGSISQRSPWNRRDKVLIVVEVICQYLREEVIE